MYRFLTVFLLLSFLTGCTGLPSILNTPQPVPDSTNIPNPTATSVLTATPTATLERPSVLRIWVLPQFDPAAQTPAGALLQARLDEFTAQHPEIQVDVRVKAGNIQKALTTTQAAAPNNMPDIVTLSRTDLESASMAGLLHPLDGLSSLPDNPDWYPYARQIAHIKNTAYGLPFAGDAFALVGYASPLPAAWNELPEETLFVFPAANPQALFPLSLYLSAGGVLTLEQGILTVDEEILTEVLSFFVPSDENGFISPLVTEYQTDQQSWNALLDQRGNLTVTWVSNYLQGLPPFANIAPLPGMNSGQYTLGTGWSWALAGSNLENESLAVELAEFLTESTFLAEWNQASGHLSTRPTALSSREDVVIQLSLSQTAESAYLIPSQEILTIIGPLVSQAVQAVIKGEMLPTDAAQTIVEQLK